MHIQVMKIFKTSFQNVWNHMLEWFRVAYAPLWIMMFGLLFMIFIYWYVGYPLEFQQLMMNGVNKLAEVNPSQLNPSQINPPQINPPQPRPLQPLIGLAHSVYFITHLIFAISIYINNVRYAVLHEGGKKWWTLNLNWRFVKMILYALLLSLLGGTYTLIAIGVVVGAHYLFLSVAADIILGTIFFIYGFYLLFRVSLYSVLIALDKPNPLRTSWKLLKGNVLRLAGLYFLLILALLGITLLGVMGLGLLGIGLDLVRAGLSAIPICLFVFFMFEFIFSAVMTKASALVYQMVSAGKDL